MGELDIIDGFVYHLSFSDSYPTVISRHHSGYCIKLFIIPRFKCVIFKAQDTDEKIIVGSTSGIDIDFRGYLTGTFTLKTANMNSTTGMGIIRVTDPRDTGFILTVTNVYLLRR